MIAIQEEKIEAETETEQLPEGNRKRKRNEEETEEEKEADELISESAHVVMKETLMQKDFIGERGFMKLISSLREVIDKRGWSLFCEHKPVGFAIVV